MPCKQTGVYAGVNKMIRTALIVLSLAFLLTASGCAGGASDQKPAGDGKKEKAPVGNTAIHRPAANQAQGQKNSPREAPDIVIRTDNRVSNQEASAMLDEVDKQLNDLINTLDRLDDLDDKELQY